MDVILANAVYKKPLTEHVDSISDQCAQIDKAKTQADEYLAHV